MRNDDRDHRVLHDPHADPWTLWRVGEASSLHRDTGQVARDVFTRAHAALGAPLDRLALRPGAADALTGAGLAASLAAAALAATGSRRSLWLWLTALAADGLDGQVARRGGAAPGGALRDSVSDRVADAALAAGVCVRETRAHHHLAASLAATAGLAGALPSYVAARAQAEGLEVSRAAPGRLERCLAWAVVLAFPSRTSLVCAAVTATSLVSAARRASAASRSASLPAHTTEPSA